MTFHWLQRSQSVLYIFLRIFGHLCQYIVNYTVLQFGFDYFSLHAFLGNVYTCTLFLKSHYVKHVIYTFFIHILCFLTFKNQLYRLTSLVLRPFLLSIFLTLSSTFGSLISSLMRTSLFPDLFFLYISVGQC